MKITNDNYFSREVAKEFASCSQLKTFMECEARAMAEINGEYEFEATDSMLLGSLVDCMLLTPNELPNFIETHPQIYKKNGELYAKFANAETMVNRCKMDKKFMSSLKGEHQQIFKGEIFGVPFRAKLDVFNDGKYITDLKTSADLEKEYYSKEESKYVNFLKHFRYDLQGAIYSELVYQNTGQRLPFMISAVTSQSHPRIRVYHIDEDSMEKALNDARPYIERIPLLKSGQIEPSRCHKCDYCADTDIVEDVTDWLGREYEDED